MGRGLSVVSVWDVGIRHEHLYWRGAVPSFDRDTQFNVAVSKTTYTVAIPTTISVRLVGCTSDLRPADDAFLLTVCQATSSAIPIEIRGDK